MGPGHVLFWARLITGNPQRRLCPHRCAHRLIAAFHGRCHSATAQLSTQPRGSERYSASARQIDSIQVQTIWPCDNHFDSESWHLAALSSPGFQVTRAFLYHAKRHRCPGDTSYCLILEPPNLSSSYILPVKARRLSRHRDGSSGSATLARSS